MQPETFRFVGHFCRSQDFRIGELERDVAHFSCLETGSGQLWDNRWHCENCRWLLLRTVGNSHPDQRECSPDLHDKAISPTPGGEKGVQLDLSKKIHGMHRPSYQRHCPSGLGECSGRTRSNCASPWEEFSRGHYPAQLHRMRRPKRLMRRYFAWLTI
jgi:hypothetical protein